MRGQRPPIRTSARSAKPLCVDPGAAASTATPRAELDVEGLGEGLHVGLGRGVVRVVRVAWKPTMELIRISPPRPRSTIRLPNTEAGAQHSLAPLPRRARVRIMGSVMAGMTGHQRPGVTP